MWEDSGPRKRHGACGSGSAQVRLWNSFIMEGQRRSARLQQKAVHNADASLLRVDSSEHSETPQARRKKKAPVSESQQHGSSSVGGSKAPIFPTSCFLSGLLATIGAIGGKLAFSSAPDFVVAVSPVLGYLFRATMLVLMVSTNGASLKYYINALCELSAFQTTTICFAANFFFSGFCGLLFFGETLALKWYIGSSLMCLGVYVMLGGGADRKRKISAD